MAERQDKYANIGVAREEANDQLQPSTSRIEEGDFVTQTEEQQLSRGLRQRHVGLIAIAGAIVCH